MELRFYIDSELEQPHIYEHGVTEEEVRQVLLGRGDDFRGRKKSRIKFGQTLAGRYLKVIYQPDELHDSIFVITAYDMKGKPAGLFGEDKGEGQDEKDFDPCKE
jgi:hypothetical protein